MADPMEDFFKKKAEKKKKGKKGAVMDMNSLASNLERAAEAAEEEAAAKAREEAEKAAKAESFQALRKAEDSDWHDYVEPTADLRISGLKVMDAEAEAVEEEEKQEAEDVVTAAAARKTWATGEEGEEEAQGSDHEEPIVAPVEPTEAPTKSSYVPPAQRREKMGWGTQPAAIAPDVKDSELFPSLADADEKAKEQEAELKRMEQNRAIKTGAAGKGSMKGGKTTLIAGGAIAPSATPADGTWTEIGKPSTDGKYRPGALAGARKTPAASSGAYVPAGSASTPSAAAPARTPGAYVPPSKPVTAPSSGAYVPAGAAAAAAPSSGAYQPPASRGAWGAAPPPPAAPAPEPAAPAPAADSGPKRYIPPSMRNK